MASRIQPSRWVTILFANWGTLGEMFHRIITSLFALLIALLVVGCQKDAGSTGSSSAAKPKIGFIVKNMADSWFQVETKFAQDAADEIGAELIVQEAKDGNALMNLLSTMKTQGVQGVIICAPEVQLGQGIVAKCEEEGLKLMTVDDRLVDADGNPIESVPHLGISATKIGELVGETIANEAKSRGWNMSEVGAITVLVEGLQTAEERVNGASSKLIEAGLPKENVFLASWTGADVNSAIDSSNPVISQHPEIKHWVCYSSNDDGMIGAVRALEVKGFAPADIIGVGINGKLVAQEFAKGKESGIFASVMLKASEHGGQTVKAMYKWITEGTAPDPLTLTLGDVITKENYKEKIAEEGITLD